MERLYTFLMGDEVISTIPERENDEFIKSCIDDLVPFLRESEFDIRSLMWLFHTPLFDNNDDLNIMLMIISLFDEEFEDISSLDPPESTPVIDESSLLVTPLPNPKQICLREVERFDHFFSLTQSGERLGERPILLFFIIAITRPAHTHLRGDVSLLPILTSHR
ncbi:hypothetical protein Tco_0655945 [Tanacetum coccineum]|uniref:Uncharacterized protein n=1 Tax=Tanacetum coccineum TaxID=301880 RepID=A0ABQ4X7I9_9ASTR